MTESFDLTQTFSTPVGRLLWPSLVKTTFDLGKNECWVCGMELTDDQSNALLAITEATLADVRKRVSTFPRSNTFKDGRGREDFLNMPYKQAMQKQGEEKVPKPGFLQWSFKRKALTAKGTQASPPVILSPRGEIVAQPPEIGHGSMGRVFFRTLAYDNASKGVMFYLAAVQISSLAQDEIGGADPIEGDWDPTGTTGSSRQGQGQPQWNPGPLSGEDDEIPF